MPGAFLPSINRPTHSIDFLKHYECPTMIPCLHQVAYARTRMRGQVSLSAAILSGCPSTNISSFLLVQHHPQARVGFALCYFHFNVFETFSTYLLGPLPSPVLSFDRVSIGAHVGVARHGVSQTLHRCSAVQTLHQSLIEKTRTMFDVYGEGGLNLLPLRTM